ncbi:hypothetical protein [Mesorhizobium sp. LjNodule214]|uniref:hypothetical protein n=1 Tax=Mesorhizobium sp. LjNodule214 TaxID=3342252 RepID=UPI003ECEE195
MPATILRCLARQTSPETDERPQHRRRASRFPTHLAKPGSSGCAHDIIVDVAKNGPRIVPSDAGKSRCQLGSRGIELRLIDCRARALLNVIARTERLPRNFHGTADVEWLGRKPK